MRGLGDWVKVVKALRIIVWWLQNSHGNVKYNIGSIFNIIAITIYSARWILEILGGKFWKVYDCQNIMQYT